MIAELGLFALILSLMVTVILIVLPSIGLVNQRYQFLIKVAQPAVYSQFILILLSVSTLVFCFVQDDFSVAYVAKNSHAQLPLVYKFCALWGAHEGSLLLWALLLAAWTLAVALKKLPSSLKLTSLIILGLINLGFLWLLLQTSNPFVRWLPISPSQGADLNPLLQDPGFVLHPPMLYIGYVGLSVPFAMGLAHLLVQGKEWRQYARPWALLAWAFLTLGIVLGSWWAYYELGWGGWWFWDPVENASLMPWLMASALLHALFARGQFFESWSILLAIFCFVLSLIGTFLVRSGVLSSVHAFASDPLRGAFILSFLALVLIGSLTLYFVRRKVAILSFTRQSALLLLGTLLLGVAALTVLLGTLYPLIMEILHQQRLSVGPPYFNSVFMPIMVPILILMGITPHIIEKENWRAFGQRMKKSLLGIVLILILALWVGRKLPVLTLVQILLGLWLMLATLRFISFNLRKMGMLMAHFGMGMSILAIALVNVLEIEQTHIMMVGQTVQLGQFDFTLHTIKDIQAGNFQGKQAHFTVKKHNKTLAQLYPEKRFFIARELVTTESAISAHWWQDFYIALGEKLEDDRWSVRLYIKPFVRWIWAGGLLMALGACIASRYAFKEIA